MYIYLCIYIYRWTWIWQTQWDQENWSVKCKVCHIHMTNTWYASDWDQAYRPSYAKIRRTEVRHIQVHLYICPHVYILGMGVLRIGVMRHVLSKHSIWKASRDPVRGKKAFCINLAKRWQWLHYEQTANASSWDNFFPSTSAADCLQMPDAFSAEQPFPHILVD